MKKKRWMVDVGWERDEGESGKSWMVGIIKVEMKEKVGRVGWLV